MRLHLGAFDQGIDGWVNSDITPQLLVGRVPGLAWLLHRIGKIPYTRFEQHKRGVFRKLRYLDLTKPLPFKANSIEAIFSSHVFEHLFMDEVERLISECYRVLQPDGVIRVVVPDLEKIICLYDAEDPRRFLVDIYEVATRSAVKNSHHSAFTGKFLTKLFKEAGFSTSEILSYQKGRCPDISLLDNRPDSLFFEASK